MTLNTFDSWVLPDIFQGGNVRKDKFIRVSSGCQVSDLKKKRALLVCGDKRRNSQVRQRGNYIVCFMREDNYKDLCPLQKVFLSKPKQSPQFWVLSNEFVMSMKSMFNTSKSISIYLYTRRQSTAVYSCCWNFLVQ